MSSNEYDYAALTVGDLVAVHTFHGAEQKLHWTLGTVESPPYQLDVEVRLWARQRPERAVEANEQDVPETLELMRRMAQAKEDLQNSIQTADELTQHLRERREAIVKSIEEANAYVNEAKAVVKATRQDVENISDKYWLELKSYRIAPKMVTVLMRAVMLLLSEDEARTWPQIQHVLRDWGFKSRITDYDPDRQLSPERREYILRECVSKPSFRYDRAMQGSAAAGPIYYWVLSQLDAGEAQWQRSRVEQRKVAQQRELHQVLKQIAEQQRRIGEYEELVDSLDEQLRVFRRRMSAGGRGHGSATRARGGQGQAEDDGFALARYQASFAGREGKDYLRPGFYLWRPTEHILLAFRRNVICNFGPVTSLEKSNGYTLEENQLRVLDAALLRKQREMQLLSQVNAEEQQRRAEADDRELENALFQPGSARRQQQQQQKQQEESTQAGSPAMNDDAILKERELRQAKATIGITDQLHREFAGAHWELVLQEAPEELKQTFVAETAELFAVAEHDVRLQEMRLGSLLVDFLLTHDGSRTLTTLQREAEQFAYPKMHILYTRYADQLNSGRLRSAHDLDEANRRGADRLSAAADEDEDDEEEDSDHQVRFGGDGWPDALSRSQEQVIAAFLTDTHDATGLAESDIVLLDVRADDEGLVVDYHVTSGALRPSEVQSRVDAYAYPAVWRLYQEQLQQQNEALASAAAAEKEKEQQRALEQQERSVAEEARRSSVAVAHSRRFPGTRWAALLPRRREAIYDAFMADTSNILRVSAKDITITGATADAAALQVNFTAARVPLPAADLHELVGQYHYPQLWALYDHLIAESTGATHQRSFQGAHWASVLSRARPELTAAFAHDSADALGVAPRQVLVRALDAGEDRLLVCYDVTAAVSTAKARLEPSSERRYPRTWSLYDQLGKGIHVPLTNLSQHLDGPRWDEILVRQEAAVREAFTRDLVGALPDKLRPADVLIVSTAADTSGLTVHYSLGNVRGLQAYELGYILLDYSFPALHALYEGRPMPAAPATATAMTGAQAMSGELERCFDGADWATVLEVCAEETLAAAFRRDAAKALALPAPERVRVLELRLGSLKVRYQVCDPTRPDAEIARCVNAAAFPELEDLYAQNCRAARRGSMPTVAAPTGPAHEKKFYGPCWPAVVEAERGAALRAFQADTAEALGLVEAEAVQVVGLRASAAEEGGAAAATFCYALHTPATPLEASEAAQVERIEAHAYRQLWALYASVAERGWVSTEHEVSFEGDGWAYVLREKAAVLEKAVLQCTAAACELEPRHISRLHMRVGSLIVAFALRHPPTLTAQAIDDKLHACPYTAVWDLYEEPPEELTQSTHEIALEGEAWRTVLELARRRLHAALLTDALAALAGTGVTALASLHIDLLTSKKDALLAKLTISHPAECGEGTVQERLGQYGYGTTWALYEEILESNQVTTTHQSVFEGDRWGGVERDFGPELRLAFRVATAELLHVEEADIRGLRLKVLQDSLLIEFDVVHRASLTEKAIRDALTRCPYTEVWELYARASSAQGSPTITTTATSAQDKSGAVPPMSGLYEVHFEGAGWAEVLTTQRAALQEALLHDIAAGLDLPPATVQCAGLSFDKAQAALRAQLLIQHASAQDVAALQERLYSQPYESVWALYPIAAVVVSIASPSSTSDTAAPTAPREDESGAPRPLSGELERCFDGADWATVLEVCAEETLAAAFRRDAAKALALPAPERVRVLELRLGSLKVRYQVCDPTRPDAEIARCVNAAAFPELEDLYAHHHILPATPPLTPPAPAAPAPPMRSTPPPLPRPTPTPPPPPPPPGRYFRSFPGDKWHQCVRERCDLVERTFEKSTAEALELHDYNAVAVQALSVDDESIRFGYHVSELAALTADFVRHRTDAFEYEALWALYHDTITTAQVSHVLHFQADDWPGIVRHQRDKLAEAIRQDAAVALHAAPDAVRHVKLDVDDQQLSAEIEVSHPKRFDAAEVRAALEAEPFRRLWALYDIYALSQPLCKVFEGDGWALVCGGATEAVRQAFAADLAENFDIAAAKVQIETVTPSLAGLQFDFALRGTGLDERLVETRLQACAFRRVWALYQPPSDHVRGEHLFRGANWIEVLAKRSSEVAAAFVADAAAALGLAPAASCVAIAGMEVEEDAGLKVKYDVAPDTDARRRRWPHEVRAVLEVDSYPTVYKLYGNACAELAALAAQRAKEAALASRESGELERVFEGPYWAQVLAECPNEVEEGFRHGAAAALQLPRAQVTVTDMRCGSLHVRYTVRGCPLADDAITRRVGECEFAELMALYAAKSAEIEARCAAPPAVAADYIEEEDEDEEKRRQPAAIEEEKAGEEKMSQSAHAAAAPLAPRRHSQSVLHEMAFQGDAWDFVLAHRGEQLKEAIELDVVEALDIHRNHVEEVTMTVKQDALVVMLHVQPKPGTTAAAMCAAMDGYAFDRVWALYCPPDEAPVATRCFAHEEEEEEEEGVEDGQPAALCVDPSEPRCCCWARLLHHKRELLTNAFVKDAAHALHVNPSDLEVRAVTCSPQAGLVVRYVVHFSSATAEELSNALRGKQHFPHVYALCAEERAAAAAAAAAAPRVISIPRSIGKPATPRPCRKLFLGECWPLVVQDEALRLELEDAFAHDAATALRLPRTSIQVDSTFLTQDGVLVGCTVKASRRDSLASGLSSDETIEAALEGADYPTVWALYHRVSRVSGELERVFEGPYWAQVLAECPNEVEEGFRHGAAAALQLPRAQVTVTDMRCGSLHVRYTVRGCPLADDAITRRVGECEFAELMALYAAKSAPFAAAAKKRPSSVSSAASRDSFVDLLAAFEGEAWAAIVQEQREELIAAFQRDTAHALNVFPLDVTVQRMTCRDGLQVDCRVHQRLRGAASGASLSASSVDSARAKEQTLQQRIDQCGYAEVWGLYEAHIEALEATKPVYTSHEVTLEGAGWAEVEQREHMALHAALRHAAACACMLTEEDITELSTSTTADALRATMTIAHPATLSPETLSAMLHADPFAAVWALYTAPSATSSAEADMEDIVALHNTFEGEAWGRLLAEHEPALRELLCQDLSHCLRLPQDAIAVTAMRAGSLEVDLTVRGSGRAQAELQQCAAQYDYPLLWDFYATHAPPLAPVSAVAASPCYVASERPVAPGEAAPLPVHEVIFNGVHWKEVVPAVTEGVVADAFIHGTAAALHTTADQICVTQLHCHETTLAVHYTVQPSAVRPLSSSELERQVATSAYARLWELYRGFLSKVEGHKSARDGGTAAEGGSAASVTTSWWSEHEVVFPGEDWDFTLASRAEAVHEAFRTCVVTQLGLSKDDVQNVQTTTTTEAENINSSSNHSVSGTGRHLIVRFALNRPATLSVAAVDAQLRLCAFSPVWALYLPRPQSQKPRSFADEDTIHTDDHTASLETHPYSLHDVSFEGDDWAYTLEKHRHKVQLAFVSDVAAALDLSEDSVRASKMQWTARGMVVTARVDQRVSHSPTAPRGSGADGAAVVMPPECITAALQRCPFERVWALYEPRPQPSLAAAPATHAGPAETRPAAFDMHQICFAGDGWQEVRNVHLVPLQRALRTDVAAALGVPEANVAHIQTIATPTMLEATVQVATHNLPRRSVAATQLMLNTHPFEHVWRLYVELTRHNGSPSAVPLDTNDNNNNNTSSTSSSTSTTTSVSAHEAKASAARHSRSKPRVSEQQSLSDCLTRRFDGVDWDLLLDEQEEAVRSAFVRDTADVLQCARANVLIEEMLLGSLLVKFHVSPLHMRREKAQELVDNYAYPHVWAIYQPRTTSSVSRQRSSQAAVALPVHPAASRSYRHSVNSSVPSQVPPQVQAQPQRPPMPQAAPTTPLRAPTSPLKVFTPPTPTPPCPPRPAPLPQQMQQQQQQQPQPCDQQPPLLPVKPTPTDGEDEEADEEELRARAAAELAARRAEEATKAEQASITARLAAEQKLQDADVAARRSEAAAAEALARAQAMRAEARAAADAAAAEEQRRVRAALEEKQRAVEAAQRAKDAAEEARRRRVKPLDAVELANEEESLTYLRKALAEARRERDEYLEMIERTGQSPSKRPE